MTSADATLLAFGGLSFAIEAPTPFYADVPLHMVSAYPGPSPGSASDWTMAPAIHFTFILLTAVVIPLFISRLLLRFGCQLQLRGVRRSAEITRPESPARCAPPVEPSTAPD